MSTFLVNIAIFGSVLLFFVSKIFILAWLKKDNGVMDIAYGPAFLVGAAATLRFGETVTVLPHIMFIATAIWAFRLAIRIYRKNKGRPEDARYAAWREEWSARGGVYFLLRSYFQIYLLQGTIVFLISLPFLISTAAPTISWPFVVVGAAVFAFGLFYETLADRQLDAFLARKRAGTEPEPIMTTGLFRFSRRPNYFGETLIWWGLAIMVLPLPFGWLALISPLLITYIVTRVTGPMLERIFLEKYPAEYSAYMARTSYFIPWRPKY